MTSISFKYQFSNDACVILEAKVNGLPEGTPIGQIYHWLLYGRSDGRVSRLIFRGMSTDGDRQTRTFEQGNLMFDTTSAELSLTGEAPEVLRAESAERVPGEVSEAVAAFLKDDPGA